jgi:hypothetical protein
LLAAAELPVKIVNAASDIAELAQTVQALLGGPVLEPFCRAALLLGRTDSGAGVVWKSYTSPSGAERTSRARGSISAPGGA